MSLSGATSSKAKVPAKMEDLNLDLNNLCKTTGWHNNCGLNCLTHFLFNKLSNIPEAEFDLFLGENPEYLALLDTFKQYYSLNKEFGWQGIIDLLKAHLSATDKEAILAPVLRAHLGKVLLEHADELWLKDASAAISEFRTTGRVADVAAPIYHSNRAFFDRIKAEFEVAFIQALEKEPSPYEIETAINGVKNNTDNLKIKDFQPSQNDVLEHIIFQRKTNLEAQYHDQAHLYWMTQGCKRYADFVANMANSEMVSADQLQCLGKRLNIGVEVYTPASMRAALLDENLARESHGAQWLPEPGMKWTMRVLNMGAHWTFQEPDSNPLKKAEHNQYYEGAVSKFKTGTHQAQSKDLIIAEVRCLLGEISEAELSELKAISAIAQQLASVSLVKPTTFRKDLQAVFDATPAGKEFIAMFLVNKDLLKLVNEQFDINLAQLFMKNHSGIVQKVKAMNAPSQIALFTSFLTKNKPLVKSATSPLFSALEEAMSVQTPPMITLVIDTERKGIKLALYAIMEKNEAAKKLAALIEKDATSVAAFNKFSTETVRAIATLPKLAEILPVLEKFNAKERMVFLEKYVASIQVSKTAVVANKSQ